uniref:Secreted protein n=1 Tax=Parastrongyloides trichosuri TaxID=131310 RepID=A0A0N4ZJ11_PARTI
MLSLALCLVWGLTAPQVQAQAPRDRTDPADPERRCRPVAGRVVGSRARRPDLDLPPAARRDVFGWRAVQCRRRQILSRPHHRQRLDQRPEGPVRADPQRRGRRPGHPAHPTVPADGDTALCPGLGRRGDGVAEQRRDQRRHAGRHWPVQTARLAARQPADPDPPRRLLGHAAAPEHRRLPLHQRPDRRLRRRQRRRRGRLPQLSRARERAVQRRADAPRPVLRHRPRGPDSGGHVRLRPADRQPLFASGAGLCRPDRPLSARPGQGASTAGRGGLSQRHRRHPAPAAPPLCPAQRRGADFAAGRSGHPREDREPGMGPMAGSGVQAPPVRPDHRRTRRADGLRHIWPQGVLFRLRQPRLRRPAGAGPDPARRGARCAASCHSGPRAEDRPARHHERGLCPHRPRQGAERQSGPVATRAQERLDPRPDHSGTAVPLPAGGRHHHRERLLPARPRPTGLPGHHPARPDRGAERGGGPGLRRGSGGGHRRQADRPLRRPLDGHGPFRPRRAVDDHGRGAELPRRGLRRRRHRRRNRHAAGPDSRRARRLDRRTSHARQRPDLRLPRPVAGRDDHSRHGAGRDQRRHRHRRLQHSRLHPCRARRGARAVDPRIRSGRPHGGQVQGPDLAPAHPAQSDEPAGRAGGDPVRRRHRGRGGPVLCRSWRPAAHAQLGPDAGRSPDHDRLRAPVDRFDADPEERQPVRRPRRDPRPRRRERLGQVNDGAGRAGPDAAPCDHDRRDPPERSGRLERPRRRDAAGSRPRRWHHLSGADDGAEPRHDHRRSGRRDGAPAQKGLAQGGPRRRPFRAGSRRPARRTLPPEPLSARVVGRPEPARRHRHRHRPDAQAADRGRGDDGAGRDDAGSGAGPADTAGA